MDPLYSCQSLPVFYRIKAGGPLGHPQLTQEFRGHKIINMMPKTCVFALMCLGLTAAIQSFAPMALAQRSDGDGNRVYPRTDSREYEAGLDYPAGNYAPASDRATLPKYIADYANMIRNDMYLLDNLLETRVTSMRKRGNTDASTQTDNLPCSCVLTVGGTYNNYVNLTEVLGMGNWFPKQLLNYTCDASKCAKPFICQEIVFDVTVLHGSTNHVERALAGDLYLDMPNTLKLTWVPRQVPVIAGCLCTPNVAM